jgi:hypothetical protein
METTRDAGAVGMTGEIMTMEAAGEKGKRKK